MDSRPKIAPLRILLFALTACAFFPSAKAEDVGAPAFGIESARYTGELREKKLAVSADFVVQLLRDGKTFVPLLPADAAIADLKVEKGEAHPCRTALGAGFSAEKKGEYRISLRFVLSVDARGKTGRVVFPLAGAGQAWIDLGLPPGQKVETKPEAPVEASPTPASTTAVRIFPQGGDQIEIEWFPKEYAKEAEPLMEAQESADIRVESGLITRLMQLDLNVIRGRVDALRIRFPQSADLRSFQGEGVREWRVERTAEGKEIAVTFLNPVRGPAKLNLSLQEPFALGGQIAVAPVAVKGVTQQQGRLVIRPGSEVSIREVGVTGARKSDSVETPAKTRSDTSLVYEYEALPAEVRLIAEAAKPRLTADVQSFAMLERGIISISSVIEYGIRGARVRSFRTKVPAELSVMSVTGPCPLDWAADAGTLLVRLRGHAEDKFALKIEAQQNLAKMNGIPIVRLETLDTEAETGTLGVAVGPDVNLIPFSATKTRQVDPSQLPDWMQKRGAKLGYAYSEKGGVIAVSTIKVEPRITAKAVDVARCGPEAVFRKVAYECIVEQRPVFAFNVKLPAGVTVTGVTGDRVADWTVNPAGDSLTVNLASEVTGPCAFAVETETRPATPATSVKLGAFELDKAEKVEGWLGIAPHGDVDLKATSTTGLTSVAAGELPSVPDNDLPPIFGYKFSRVGWTLALDVTPLAPEFDVTLLSLLRFRPGLLSVVAEAQCNIKKAGINTFEIVLPKGALNSTIEADALRSSEFKNGVWRLELMNKVKGEYVFTINYDCPLGGLSGSLAYTGARVRGATNETGFDIVAQEKSDAEIAVGEVVGAAAVDESELPREFAERVTIPIVRTYRWSAPDRSIAFKVTGHLAGKTLQATIPVCEIRTLLKREGQAINYLSCPTLSNTKKQFVKIDLGPNSRLWAAYVDGRPVKASRDPDGAVLVPILGKGRGQMEMGLIWSEPSAPMGFSGRQALVAPRMDVQIQAVTWKVYVPGDYQLLSASGNMEMQPTRAEAAGIPTILANKFGWIVSWVFSAISPLLVVGLVIAVIVGVIIGIIVLFRRGDMVVPLVIVVAVILCVGYLLTTSMMISRESAPRHVKLALEAPMAPAAAPAPRGLGDSDGRRTDKPAQSVLTDEKSDQFRDEIGMKQKAMPRRQAADEYQVREKGMQEDEVSKLEEVGKDRSAGVLLRKRTDTALKEGMELDNRELRKKAQSKAEAKAPAQQPAPAPAAPAPPGAPAEAPAGAGAAGGGGALGYADGKFAHAPKKPMAGPRAAALGVATSPAMIPPIGAIDKFARMQQQEGETQLVSNLVGGRAKGALPIEITFPTAGTVAYEFRMPFAGETQGTVKMRCLSVGLALCLQGLIGLIILGAGIGLGWRRARGGALVAAGGILLLVLVRTLSGPASAEYLRMAQWAASAVLLVLLGKLLAGRMRPRDTGV